MTLAYTNQITHWDQPGKKHGINFYLLKSRLTETDIRACRPLDFYSTHDYTRAVIEFPECVDCIMYNRTCV